MLSATVLTTYVYYCRTMSGLLHAPFSLIVYAAPVLSMDSFTYLREIAWDTLLDADQDLSVAAGTNLSIYPCLLHVCTFSFFQLHSSCCLVQRKKIVV